MGNMDVKNDGNKRKVTFGAVSEGGRPSSRGNQKRVSFGDVSEGISQSRRSSSPGTQLAKFKTVAKFALIGAKIRHHSEGQVSLVRQPELSEKDLIMNQKSAGRRGTVHGSQMYMATDGLTTRRRTDENVGRIGSANINNIINQAKTRQEAERLKRLRRLKMWVRVVGKCCNLQSRIIHRNSLDPVYVKQMENIGKTSPLEKDSYGSNRIDLSYFKANTQMRMSQRAVSILTKPPELRTNEEIKYAMNALCNVHFISKFPLKIQKELATHGYVECYEAKRFILRQGGAPENAYIVLYGSILTALLDEHKLSATSVDSLITRGQQFGEIGIYRNKPRGGSNITAEYTEILRIPGDEFKRIFMGAAVDPENDPFLKKFKFLKNWPLKELRGDPNKYITTFYQRNIALTSNSNRSPWIYIVKEGSLRIMKRLEKVVPTVNKKTGHFNEEAHQSGYLSFLTRDLDYDRYANYHSISLPPPLQYNDNDLNTSCDSQSSNELSESYHNLSVQALPLLHRLENVLRPHTAGAFLTTPVRKTPKSKKRTSKSAHPSQTEVPKIKPSSSSPDDNATDQQEKENQNIPKDDGKKTIAKRTIYDDFDLVDNDKEHVVTAAERNPQWVHVQTLTKDQVFGLQYVVFDKSKQPQPSFVVISNGAEVVQIDKQLFLSKLDMNAREKLRSEISPYPTDEELQAKLVTRINWESYKDIVLDQVAHERQKLYPNRLKTCGTYRLKSANVVTQSEGKESSIYS
ncbi:hypothetical protein FSP39_001127 [Pinctada imbricata]|uniref:Cyclic nucleotide-binding domain-containing protein n=1 Tax=Pinctada imbricata TaxID=66713 RepID=A0AA88YAA8_PINIB|nr:hypothetical protein FSP39_001127 [Pinctada imbricata]